jgi:hypothetical protein
MIKNIEKGIKVGDQVLLFNSRFKFSAGKLASKWQGPFVVQEVYRSGTIRLHGYHKGKPHVVHAKRSEAIIAGEKFIGKVEELNDQSSEAIIAKKYPLIDIRYQ